jgi:hypothetical protein
LRRRYGVQRKIGRLNVEHFRKLLATETDENKRQMLLRLLAEEEAKLKAVTTPPRDNVTTPPRDKETG